MSRHTMMNVDDVENFKVVAKGKKKRGGPTSTPDEISTPSGSVKTVKGTNIVRSGVPIPEIKGVLNETIWRVLHEIYPGMPYNDAERLNSDEYFGYCVMLTLLTGAGMDKNRQGMKIREASSGEPRFCREHN